MKRSSSITDLMELKPKISEKTNIHLFLFSCGIAGIFCVFIARLMFLQILQGKLYRAMADDNRFTTRYITPTRGVFFDRSGSLLVKNEPVYKKISSNSQQINPTLEIIDKQIALDLLSQNATNILIDQKRAYIYGPALSPVLGYTGEVTQRELEQDNVRYLGENVGKTGLEKTMQEVLAGSTGKEVLETNASGIVQRKISETEPIAGKDLRLTIDASLSAKAYDLLGGREGAVVASNPKTGEIYALVSSPSYDAAHIADALTDSKTPLLNRAISGVYPPGSTFKLMTALSALTSHAVTADTEVFDAGEIKVGDAVFRNWYFSQYGRTEGNISLERALQRSNDVYFYKAAELAGPDAIATMATLFQFGVKTGIELPGESAGTIPSPAWKELVVGEKWYLGDTYHTGIGQGNVLVTPIQLNQATAAIANGSVWCRPTLLLGKQSDCKDLGVSPEYLQVVINGMKAACASGGTAYPLFTFTPTVACKTGTAEFGAADAQGRKKTHAWLTAFAPADNPQIAITVLVEGTGDQQFLEGSTDAAPIVKELLQMWFAGL